MIGEVEPRVRRLWYAALLGLYRLAYVLSACSFCMIKSVSMSCSVWGVVLDVLGRGTRIVWPFCRRSRCAGALDVGVAGIGTLGSVFTGGLGIGVERDGSIGGGRGTGGGGKLGAL